MTPAPARPWLTWLIAGATIAVSAAILLSRTLDPAAMRLGFVPALLGHSSMLAPLTSTLVHGSWLHLTLNIVVFIGFGRLVEEELGKGWLAAIYGLGAYAAAAAQWIAEPHAMAPMIGASGAISACLGAYVALASTPRVGRLTGTAAEAIHLAWVVATWSVVQWLTAGAAGPQHVAIAAHIGGFVAGLCLIRPIELARRRDRMAMAPVRWIVSA